MATDKSNKIPNAPHLRFPEFIGEWEKVSLTDIASFSTERVNSSKLDYHNYVSTENMLQNYQGIIEAVNVPDEGNVVKYTKGDTLISNIRPYLRKVWLSDREGGCSADILVLSSIKTTCINEFLYNIIANDSFIDYVMSGAKGVKMPRGDKKQIATYTTAIPSIEEQRKISAFLTLVNQRIETQIGAIEKLESLISSLNNQFQEQYCTDLELSFSEIGTEYSGLTGKTAEDFGSGCPFVPYTNVYANTFIDESNLSLVRISDNEKQSLVKHGDVLFTLSSETPEEVCMGSVYMGNEEKLFLNSFCFGIHIDNKQIFPPFIAYYINSTHFRKAVFPFAQGSTRFNLQKYDFLKKRFIFPNREKQHQIAEVLGKIESKIIIEQQILNRLKQQKQYLLSEMFV